MHLSHERPAPVRCWRAGCFFSLPRSITFTFRRPGGLGPMRFTQLQRSVLICSLFFVAGARTVALRAQDDGVNGPPKVLVIQREFTKPGKGGALHERTGAPYIPAMASAGAKPRYLAMVSLSGQSRALFFS